MTLYQYLKKSPHRKFLGNTERAISSFSVVTRNYSEDELFPNGRFFNLTFSDGTKNKFTLEMTEQESKELAQRLLNWNK